MVEEYKDVIRIEVSQNRLPSLLRKKQLGFERVTSSSGMALIRLGYRDANGTIHYFTEDTNANNGYWQPGSNGGIYYNNGAVGVGGEPEAGDGSPRFEIKSDGLVQLRMRGNNNSLADVKMDGGGRFSITLEHNSVTQERFRMGSDTLKFEMNSLFVSHYEPYSREFYIATKKRNSDIKIKTLGNYSNIHLDTGYGGGVLFRRGSGTFSSYEYNTSNEVVLNISADSITPSIGSSFRIKNERANIVLEPSVGHGVMLANDGYNVGKLSYSESNNELSLEVLQSGGDLKIKTGGSNNSGNVILEPDSNGQVQLNIGSCSVKIKESERTVSFDSVNMADNLENEFKGFSISDGYVSIDSELLKLPVRYDNTSDPPRYSDGCIYVNNAKKQVLIHAGGAWRELCNWQ